MSITVRTAHDELEIGRVVAALIEAARPRLLGVATGSSPRSTYAELVRRRSLPTTTVVALLDEYVGLPRDSPLRYRHEIERHLAGPLALTIVAPDVDAPDIESAARRYERQLEALGGVDLQLLGIGANGHIGFNEPGTPLDTETRPVQLTQSTRIANSRFFQSPSAVPSTAITQGIATILRARRIVLIAIGSSKAAALRAAIRGPLSEDCPASALQLHDDVLVVGDEAALSDVVHTERRTAP